MIDVSPRYGRHRSPPEIISRAGWLYHRFCLSFRDAEDLRAERRVIVSYKTIRYWARSSDLTTRPSYGGGKVDSVTPGSLTTSSSASEARDITCGVPLTEMVMSSTSWSRVDETPPLQGHSSASC